MRRVKSIQVKVMAALLFALAPGLANAALVDAQNDFLHGRYREAEAAAAKLKGKEADAGALLVARVQRRTGRLKEAEAGFRKLSKLKGQLGLDAAVGLAETLRARGDYQGAKRELEAVVAKDDKQYRARALLGELLMTDLGELKAGEAVFDGFYEDFNDGKIDDKNAEQMMYVAMAAEYLGSHSEANDTYHTAVDLDGNLLEANVRWGWLFVDKYAVGNAEPSFEEVLKIDPNYPDALVGMARVKLEQTYDIKAATALCDKALASDPGHPGALAIKTELLIDNAELASAGREVAKILAVNPNDLHAHALVATIAYIGDDKPGYEAAVKKALSINAKFAEVYHTVATFAVKDHRYADAIGLETQAITLRPDYYVAMAELASNYLRMGDEVKGRELLGKAFKGDGFNVRAYNLLNLYEDVIDKDYEFAVWPPASTKKPTLFRFRMQKSERPLLLPYVGPLVEKAFADMVKRYGMTPKLPITIEMFADSDHYSVRTVGLPNLGALGVCFGQVITALSPEGRSINWGMVLWHELSHVFAIQLSNNRVPRWFTEGLSEYETIIARKEWRRENDRDLWIALKTGTLVGVMDLNAAFMRAEDVLVAYHQASVTMTWMVERFGFPKVVEALKLFAQGKSTPEVLRTVTGLDTIAFDTEFRAYLAKRLKAYDGSYVINLASYADLEAREKAAAGAPDDMGFQAALALAYLNADELDKADKVARAIIKTEPKRKEALWVLGDVALRKKKDLEAKKWIELLIAAGGDGYDARGKLGLIATRTGSPVDAEKQLTLAKKMNPEASEPYELLFKLYEDKQQFDKALAELEGYAWIEQMDSKAYSMLVTKFADRGNWAKVAQWGEIAIQINPYEGKVLERVGRAYNEVGRPGDAIVVLSTALLLKGDSIPEDPATIHFELAKAYVKRKDVKRAKSEMAAAMQLKPGTAEFIAFNKTLK